MPLHLLGKKSWNVYNTDNVEKVRRDEARAKAQEEAEDERQQEIDAQRRLQLLRGEVPSYISLPPPQSRQVVQDTHRSPQHVRERKRRKRHGEDDTDFELRVAHEENQKDNVNTHTILRKSDVEAPIIDHQGHIDLFPQKKPSREVEKAAEAAKDLAKRKKEYADNYTVKFSDAAGFKKTLDSPWYSTRGESKTDDVDMPSKDAWGNEDPRRREREALRIVSNDPLAMMKQGAASARKHDMERKLRLEEQQRRMAELDREQRSRRRKRKARHDREEDPLEGFSLDEPAVTSRHARHDLHRTSGTHGRARRDDSRKRDENFERHGHRSGQRAA